MDTNLKLLIKTLEAMLGEPAEPPVSITQFLSNYKEILASDVLLESDKDIQNELNVDDESFEMIKSSCSLDELSMDEKGISIIPPKFNADSTTGLHRQDQTTFVSPKLQIFLQLSKHKEIAQKNPFKRTVFNFKMTKHPENESKVDLSDILFKEVLITIRLYRQTRAVHNGQTLEKPVFAEEFQCLGSNYLTELRDKITCVCNKKNFFDISDDPMQEIPLKETDPGYFFITRTFYNDKRNPKNADYSETIRKWAIKSSVDMNFEHAKMEETRFSDLTVSLGFPQLYQHHGNCEHVFVFSQLEVLSPSSDPLPKSLYPFLQSFNVFNSRMCHLCGIRNYNFIVEDSERHLNDPAYLCSKCYFSFHYIDDKKIGKFKAYRIHDCPKPVYPKDEPEDPIDENIEVVNTNSEDIENNIDIF